MEKQDRFLFRTNSFTKSTNSHWGKPNLYFSYQPKTLRIIIGSGEGPTTYQGLWSDSLYETYESTHQSAKFVPFILAQGSTNYYWVERRPYERPRGLQSFKAHEKYKFALGPARFVFFIPAQDPTNYHWPIEGPYKIFRATGT